MAFCTRGSYNSCVTQSIPKTLIQKFKHWLGMTEYPTDGPIIPSNDQPKGESKPLTYHPEVCELPPEMMFMHDAVFGEEQEVKDIELKFPEYKDNWWLETDADERIRGRGRDRVQQYLDESEKVELGRW